ncbi:MAG: HisA/HisF-related TIM barrel protein [Granulosicoccus sp.]
MRLGSTVLLSNQLCVQSYNWNHFRPLGKLQTVVDELEHFECDEIAIIRPVRQHDTFQSYANDVITLKALHSMTPISFGGGIRSQWHLELIYGLPIERLIFSSAFLAKNESLIESAIGRFGRQSIQCMIPVFMHDNEVFVFNCSTGKKQSLKRYDFNFISDYANEVILYDCAREGQRDCFDFRILENIDIEASRLVISGGIGADSRKKADDCRVASILIDNKTLHREYSVAGYRYA